VCVCVCVCVRVRVCVCTCACVHKGACACVDRQALPKTCGPAIASVCMTWRSCVCLHHLSCWSWLISCAVTPFSHSLSPLFLAACPGIVIDFIDSLPFGLTVKIYTLIKYSKPYYVIAYHIWRAVTQGTESFFCSLCISLTLKAGALSSCTSSVPFDGFICQSTKKNGTLPDM
jgi:hypothetical protein